uniref:hypothetical protein n=1 Tax=Alloprevotella sp. TaxID=1872471 RepID=UPI003FEE9CDB
IYYFCHIPTCFTFCAAKLRRNSELAKRNFNYFKLREIHFGYSDRKHYPGTPTYLQSGVKKYPNLFKNSGFESFAPLPHSDVKVVQKMKRIFVIS